VESRVLVAACRVPGAPVAVGRAGVVLAGTPVAGAVVVLGGVALAGVVVAGTAVTGAVATGVVGVAEPAAPVGGVATFGAALAGVVVGVLPWTRALAGTLNVGGGALRSVGAVLVAALAAIGASSAESARVSVSAAARGLRMRGIDDRNARGR
jgi:hypothetical protein